MDPTLPIVKVRIQKKEVYYFATDIKGAKYLSPHRSTGVNIYEHVININNINGLANLEANELSLQLLAQLGFIDISYENTISQDSYYLPFDCLYDWDTMLTKFKSNNPTLNDENNILILIPGKLQITPLGKRFGNVCC